VALKSGAKSQYTRPLPPPCEPARWFKQVTGQALYPWQVDVVRALTRHERPRVAYVQVARKNGKTRLAAALALLEACLKERRHVYAISDSEKNLKSTMMRELRDIIGASDQLRDSIHIFRDHIEVPETGSFIEARPGNFAASQGINPHMVLFDEVHLQRSGDTWYGMQMAGAARDDALLLGITTPGYDLSSLAHGLYEQVRAGAPGLYGRIFEADPAADIDDREAWAGANPCMARPGFVEGLEFDRSVLPEHEFRRYRLGQWTATEQAWLPYGAWAACSAPGRPSPPPGTKVWLGFDGSYSGDSTALVGVTDDLHVFVAGCWENPGRAGWRVPRDQVEEQVAEAFAMWSVQAMFCDPPYWGAEIARWAATWGDRVQEFPTFSRARMAPACSTFYSAVMERSLSHDGDPRLARHVSNAVVKASPLGDYITKEDKDSPRRIDLAVAAVIAHQAAATAHQPRRAGVFVV
jgi:phage terminase large subunit-like protein